MTRAVVVVERRATGEVCLDDGNTGHERDEPPFGADPAGERSVPPTHINLGIAYKARMATLDG
jgi:hypothetical protein